jgi:hypothetical protein
VDWFQDGLKASLQIRVRSVTSAVEAKLTLYGRSPILELSVADIVRDADGQCDWLRLQPTRGPEQQDGVVASITKVISKTIMVSFSGQTAVRLHQGCAHQPATRRGEKFPVPYNQFRTNETRSKCLE